MAYGELETLSIPLMCESQAQTPQMLTYESRLTCPGSDCEFGLEWHPLPAHFCESLSSNVDVGVKADLAWMKMQMKALGARVDVCCGDEFKSAISASVWERLLQDMQAECKVVVSELRKPLVAQINAMDNMLGELNAKAVWAFGQCHTCCNPEAMNKQQPMPLTHASY